MQKRDRFWSGRLLSWWWVSCERSTSSYGEINQNAHMRIHTYSHTVAIEEQPRSPRAPTQCKKNHTHTLSAVTTIAVRAWAMCGPALILSVPGETCILSEHQTLHQNLFYNQNMHAQMVFKDFLASNLLLSCFSLNRFTMLSAQGCFHIAWCMRLIYKCNNGNICIIGLMRGNTCLKRRLALNPNSLTPACLRVCAPYLLCSCGCLYLWI